MLKTSPTGRNIVVFDLEIKEQIDGKRVTWGTYNLMGISVGVAFHYKTMEFKIFKDDNLEELPALLNQAEIVSGFNITGFDIPLLNATAKNQFTNVAAVYDMLHESRLATGWTPGRTFPSGLKLDQHLEGTFGKDAMKTAHGSEAPLMWQSGKLGRLISYCIDDVRRECMLFENICAGHPVNTAAHGWRKLRHPYEVKNG